MCFLPYEIEMASACGEFIISLSAPSLRGKKLLAVPDIFYTKVFYMYFLINSGVLLMCIVHYN